MSPLARSRVTIDSPATTANLGAGFDCLALALDLSNRMTVEVLMDAPGALELVVEGEGEGQLEPTGTDRFTAALRMGLAELGLDPATLGLRITMRNRIPLSRGLGSSASATVAGLVAAAALTGRDMDDGHLLALACRAEGHADNAAAAILGGFVVVSHAAGDARAVRLDVPEALVAALFIPDRPLSTAAMRAALPAQVPFTDAVHNTGAAALAVAAFATGRLDLLAGATDDRLHEPYRAAAVYPELPIVVGAARAAGALGACMSGAGSTVIAFADDPTRAAAVGQAMAEAATACGLGGRSVVVRPRSTGARVID
ncbi:MAG: homoserine kinase [Chloroflexi bacterium]|nr:homoserine kinase [Chloroflexota bacterium]